ncbi:MULTISPECIES: alpha/beta fold hydrolase [unclassified Duganella]|uniref:alpha/beta fold hydrolase n=1 Tax=unclassified Duganella TaxID=2636909 RepID=UPI00088FC0C5|nr:MULTISPECIES: alpha/beta hydrolase [unclassified Duganella]SDG81775.1 Pimeloyl-ACP methyl ester carboxylesterase [Duganella sp. OV458]SDK09199.1 sigma-B regulation protein RsbQ [Duganella sp. OV510]
MSVQYRNNVRCHGDGPATIMFVHGYGCDQTMWRFIYPSFLGRYRVVLLDLVGSGNSDLSAYDRDKYSTLHGHAEDILDVIDLYAKAPIVFVGHSVSAMIGMLASIIAPEKFTAQIMVGPSASYINDGDYVGGYNPEDIDGLLKLMEIDYDDWIKRMAPAIMGAPHPALSKELLSRFERNDPEIARHFARATFTADHRADVDKSTVPALILQCSDDLIAPREVGDYLHTHLANSRLAVINNIGHCPHLSAPSASSEVINDYLKTLPLS